MKRRLTNSSELIGEAQEKDKKVIHSSNNDHVFLGTNITWVSSYINNH